MSLFKKSAKDKAADKASKVAKDASNAADSFLSKVVDAYKSSRDWAAPRFEEAADRVVPMAQDAAARVNVAAHDAADRARPYVNDAIDKARPYYNDASAYVSDSAVKVREDYLPRAKRAANAAIAEAKSSDGDIASRYKQITEATKKELTKPEKKSGKGKFIGLTLVIGAALGAAYVAWARSKPVEDPWAEAYWEDVAAPEGEKVDTAEKAQEDIKAAVAEDPTDLDATVAEVDPEGFETNGLEAEGLETVEDGEFAAEPNLTVEETKVDELDEHSVPTPLEVAERHEGENK